MLTGHQRPQHELAALKHLYAEQALGARKGHNKAKEHGLGCACSCCCPISLENPKPPPPILALYYIFSPHVATKPRNRDTHALDASVTHGSTNSKQSRIWGESGQSTISPA